MRLAIISDIHGNLVALEAVLNSLAAQHIDNILCLGDVAATGPQPCQVIERLRGIDCPVVMGNTDAWLLEPELKDEADQDARFLQDVELWGSQQLSLSDREYLQTFQPTIEFSLTEGKTLLGYHGSPRSFNEGITATKPDEEVEQAFTGVRADIMVGGHTHQQMFRRYKDMLILNPGSVGLPLDRVAPLPWQEMHNPAWAEYALVESEGNSLHVELHRTPFDLSALLEAARQSNMPHVEWWVKDWSGV